MSRFYLGELEELVLLIVALHDKNAYAIVIVEELQKQAGRDITLSAIHAVLHRLEEKGFVTSFLGGASSIRGGRRKRIFTITSYGQQVIAELRDTRTLIWSLINAKS
jgi:PadR family transcriptional regulator, regulatory protein PadR